VIERHRRPTMIALGYKARDELSLLTSAPDTKSSDVVFETAVLVSKALDAVILLSWSRRIGLGCFRDRSIF